MNAVPLRVMLVVHSLSTGGAEVMVASLAEALHRHGIAVVVVPLARVESTIELRLLESGISVYHIDKRAGFDPRVIPRLRCAIQDFQPTVVHTHLPVLPYVFPAARWRSRSIRIVHTFHSTAMMETRRPTTRIVNWVAIRSGVVAVAPSDEVRDSVLALYGVKSESVRTVLNGVELSRFQFDKEIPRDNTMRLLCVARLEPVKNHRLLLDVVATLQGAHTGQLFKLVLVGEGSMRMDLERYAAELGVESLVSFAGLQSQTESFYRDADVFVLLSRYEGLPMSVLEAMAAGVPVVATNVGGMSEVVQNGENGYLVGFDHVEIARLLSDLAGDPARWSSLSSCARETAERFSLERMMGGYLDTYS